MQILEGLVAIADEWCASQSLSKARLATIVVNSGRFFDQIERSGGGCNVATFEKFLSFFRDGDNWRDNRIPERACELLDVFANIATETAPSSGKTAQNSLARVSA